VDIMGGLDSPGWAYFKKLFKEGFEAARKHSDSLISEPVLPILSSTAYLT
jgi:phosphatidylinositol 4-kinase